jgi:hypothetical protein
MKKLITILLLIVFLIVCLDVFLPKSLYDPARPKSNTDYQRIIGTPIKIGNLEIAQYDFPERMNVENSKEACYALGKGWRLPTKDELNTMYINRVKIGGFALNNNSYWSSTEVDKDHAWAQTFIEGVQFSYENYYDMEIRAVRVF